MSDLVHSIHILEKKMGPGEIREARSLACCYSLEEISDITSEFNATDDRFAQRYIPFCVALLAVPVVFLGLGIVSRNGNWPITFIVALLPNFILLAVLHVALRHRRRGYVLSLAYYLRKKEERERETRKEK